MLRSTLSFVPPASLAASCLVVVVALAPAARAALHDARPGTLPALDDARAALATTGSPGVQQAAGCPSDWQPLPGTPYVPGNPHRLVSFDDGSGPALHVGANVLQSPGVYAAYVAKWNGSAWSPLGSGLNERLLALTVFDDGGGPALYAAGHFTSAGGVPANRIAKWDGSSWSPLGAGTSEFIRSLAVFDDGSGPALYAAGGFTSAGGVAASRVAKWDGSIWSPLGSGVSTTANTLAVFDDGSGPALYIGGFFSFTSPAPYVARWDGSTWNGVGGGMDDVVRTLYVHDDGSGPALYAGGEFSIAGGAPASRIARWDGSTWSALGAGVGGSGTVEVFALITFDDGGGPALYAGGLFAHAGGIPAQGIAKWDGAAWSALGAGNTFTFLQTVHDDGSGPSVYGCIHDDVADAIVLTEWAKPPGCGTPGASICEPGAGGASACPCGNAPAAAGLGCDNSAGTGGAALGSSGIARLSHDTLVLTTGGETPSATSVVLQGDAVSTSGVAFGQGVLCVAGTLKRMYVEIASGGSITVPAGGEPSVHVRSEALGDPIAPGTYRYYGVYYRDPLVLGACPGASTFNVTQQLEVLWSP